MNLFRKTFIVETLREIGENLCNFWGRLVFETNCGESDHLLINMSNVSCSLCELLNCNEVNFLTPSYHLHYLWKLSHGENRKNDHQIIQTCMHFTSPLPFVIKCRNSGCTNIFGESQREKWSHSGGKIHFKLQRPSAQKNFMR